MCEGKPKVLFILKHREDCWAPGNCSYSNGQLSSGLFNSATFVCDALNTSGKIEAKLVDVVDNNCIDREVHNFRPNFVIIEAYWVVPEKFEILTKLHPNVKWIIRNHSEMPFAAQEGIVMDWTLNYLNYPNVFIAGNSCRSYKDMEIIVKSTYPDKLNHVAYLPNMYPTTHRRLTIPKLETEFIDVACFGAIRPLKNHLMQAVAAIKFAEDKHKKLRFHINGGRIEGGSGSNNILKNLRELFSKSPIHALVEHDWYSHDKFLEALEKMDMGLQVSFSETFNIVGADMAHVGLPVVFSKEVLWAPKHVHADPTSSTSIYKAMCRIWAVRKFSIHQLICQWSLNLYSRRSLRQWEKEINFLSF